MEVISTGSSRSLHSWRSV